MRNLKIVNAIAIGLPLTLALLGIINNGFLYYAALSIAITGLTQLILAVIYWVKKPASKLIKIYFALVVLYFTVISLGFNNDIYLVVFTIPFLLAAFFTSILHLPFKKE